MPLCCVEGSGGVWNVFWVNVLGTRSRSFSTGNVDLNGLEICFVRRENSSVWFEGYLCGCARTGSKFASLGYMAFVDCKIVSFLPVTLKV